CIQRLVGPPGFLPGFRAAPTNGNDRRPVRSVVNCPVNRSQKSLSRVRSKVNDDLGSRSDRSCCRPGAYNPALTLRAPISTVLELWTAALFLLRRSFTLIKIDSLECISGTLRPHSGFRTSPDSCSY